MCIWEVTYCNKALGFEVDGEWMVRKIVRDFGPGKGKKVIDEFLHFLV